MSLSAGRALAPSRRAFRPSLFLAFAAALGMASPVLAAPGDRSPDGAWTALAPEEAQARRSAGSEPWIQPARFAAFEVDEAALARSLAGAPMEFTPAARDASRQAVVHLPTPEGDFERFAVAESPVAEPELLAWMASRGWPIKTYKGRSLDTPATVVRLDAGGPHGFHARVMSPAGEYWVDPYWKGDNSLRTSYRREDMAPAGPLAEFGCRTENSSLWRPEGLPTREERGFGGSDLIVFRLAMAATGEFGNFWGEGTPTPEESMAGVLNIVNRLNQVYEQDLGMRLVLVANNNLIMYTDPATDPYTSGDVDAMNFENQSNLDSVIGTANYDIGHVVDSGGGGGVVYGPMCDNQDKAKGATSLSPPVGDPFTIDFVAHEIGHQFTGSHTWDGTAGSCSPGQHVPKRAYEPGSGSTIMAYAGICDPQNVQNASDPVFHGGSIEEIGLYVPACAGQFIATANANAPTVDAGPDLMVPAGTPFVLTAPSAEDLDGDAITYSWEQFDTDGSRAAPGVDNGTNPLFRAFAPVMEPERQFPSVFTLRANQTTVGETLPTTGRTMRFRVTVRDNNPELGRTGHDDMLLTCVPGAGPFQVTFPNGQERLSGTQTILWNPANTDQPPLNAALVDITLSTDGGVTYPITLAEGVPNTGSAEVELPNIDANSARVKVSARGHIFFDITNRHFAIERVPASSGGLILR